MNILGLHFGHDAGVAVLRDGQLAACVLRERHCRVKHAMTLEFQNIETAVAEAGLRLTDIDRCAITSTQSIELLIDDPLRFSIEMQQHPADTAPCIMHELLKAQNVQLSTQFTSSLLKILFDPRDRQSIQYGLYSHFFPEHKSRRPDEFRPFPWIDTYVAMQNWEGHGLEAIGQFDVSPQLGQLPLRHGYHVPVTASLDGRRLPGYFISHHMAHAASTYFSSGFSEAAILTHDGYCDGIGDRAGMYCYGDGDRIYPLMPHHLVIGALYEKVGIYLNLGPVGAAGKLMGLAPYGKPRFFDRSYVGNWYDWKHRNRTEQGWIEHCVTTARRMGYDTAPLSDRSQMTAAINADIAASTQKLFEETYLQAVESLSKMLTSTGRNSRNLCLSGGCALNCPSNSRVAREGAFPNVHIEPGCDDSGLPIGAALFLYHNILDKPRLKQSGSACCSPYLGVRVESSQIESAMTSAREQIMFWRCSDAAAEAANDLAEDHIIGWFEGASEIGPRALGHRSILADCRRAENWSRVNRVKGREAWRPFAPAVLASEADKWFRGVPLPSPYMLFTATLRSEHVPAITHLNGSSRIQTVDGSCGEFYRVLEHFNRKTGVPMVLNTSFNGPGEPIIESPENAIRFFINSELDALYIGGFRVTKRAARDSSADELQAADKRPDVTVALPTSHREVQASAC